jgi:hypothetical protein
VGCVMAGRIGRWVMEIEEEGMVLGEDGKGGFVEEEKRIRGVECSFDMVRRRARVRCLQRLKKDGLENVGDGEGMGGYRVRRRF